MKLNYKEGTWFAVPLRQGDFAGGVVARAAVGKPILICYFFGPRRKSIPKPQEVSALRPPTAILVLRVSDLGLIRGTWPIIGTVGHWDRADWPMPVFIRREILRPFRNWRVYYSETDPSIMTNEELEPNERPDLPKAGLSGCGAAEIKLTKLLGGSEPLTRPGPPRKFGGRGRASLPASIEGGPFRVEVLQHLNAAGSDIGKPHKFDFYLYFPSETAALEAAEKIRKSEFTVEVRRSAHDDKWLCRAKRNLVPESARLDEINNFFEQIAAALHGEFDGWESDVVNS